LTLFAFSEYFEERSQENLKTTKWLKPKYSEKVD
jgi:hypothetical protein